MEKSNIYDLIIIGGGPAGITAAIYATRNKINFMLITVNIGGQVVLSSQIENYTGFQYITGEELKKKFQEHLDKYKFNLKMEEVKKVERENNLFKVMTDSNIYLSKTIIIATGRRPKELKIPGEAKFKNRGVTYCAICDAPLFEDLDVAVIGGGNSGLEAVLQLIKIAKSINLIEINPELKAEKILIEKALASNKVKIWTSTKIKEIIGDKTVEYIKIERNGKEILLPVQGVFIEIGSVPNSEIVDFVDKNVFGEIIVNCKCETNIPGLFAAGDVTNVPEKQIVVAAGEGCKAVLSALKYLRMK
ncbi:MAG: FAD-dependent oxidoreductase [Nitrososphaerota archaeon]